MTQLLMPTTLLYLAFLEGDNTIDWQHQWLVHVHAYLLDTYSTMKIIGISTNSRGEHQVAQTRELECTKLVVPQVIAWGWLAD